MGICDSCQKQKEIGEIETVYTFEVGPTVKKQVGNSVEQKTTYYRELTHNIFICTECRNKGTRNLNIALSISTLAVIGINTLAYRLIPSFSEMLVLGQLNGKV